MPKPPRADDDPRPHLRSATLWLIVANVLVFFASAAMQGLGTPVLAGGEIAPSALRQGSVVLKSDYVVVQGVRQVVLVAPDGTQQPFTIPDVRAAKPEELRQTGLAVAPDGTPLLARLVFTQAGDLVGSLRYRVTDWLNALGHFSTAKAFVWVNHFGQIVPALEVWRLVTFQFLHANLTHLALNMIGLWIFAPFVEQPLGPKRFMAFYLMCGISGGLVYLGLNFADTLGITLPGVLHVDPTTPLVGASAGVFGVIMACAHVRPKMEMMLLFPPIPLRMRTLAYGYVAVSAVNLFLIQGNNQGGDAAHLGGAAAGWFFVRNPHLLRDFFDVFAPPRRSTTPRARGPRTSRDDAERLLRKIDARGLSSLTPRERELMARASNELGPTLPDQPLEDQRPPSPPTGDRV